MKFSTRDRYVLLRLIDRSFVVVIVMKLSVLQFGPSIWPPTVPEQYTLDRFSSSALKTSNYQESIGP